MTAIRTDARIAELVLEAPGRAAVFETLGIDYCCGGKTPLDEACAARGLDVADVVRKLEEPREADAEDVDWTSATLAELIVHIVDGHHGYLRGELPSLRALVAKVANAHGDRHPELHEVEAVFNAAADELEQHMMKEETILFPACLALESGEPPAFGFGSVQNPIGVMLDDHDRVADALSHLRSLTGGYEPPANACTSFRAMLHRLATLEADTHRHVHEENNVLFPRALALEGAAASV